MDLKELETFLNRSVEELRSQPADLIEKLAKAVDEDDFMKVHHLAYAIKGG